MGNVIADMSMSLDGFSAGPNDGPENPLGDWGERPDLTGPHAEVFRESFAHAGAVVMGRRVFDNVVEPWGDTLVREGGTTYTFVTDGSESALAQAQAVAGDRDVVLGGGADIVRQFIKAGLLDELEPVRVIDAPGVAHIRFRVKS